MAAKSVQDFWGDYLFLTREMAKFIHRRDYDMFFELLEQRGKLQAMIDEMPDDSYKGTEEGRRVLTAIREEDQLISNTLKALFNKMKQEQTVSQAYDPYSAVGVIGRKMDRQS